MPVKLGLSFSQPAWADVRVHLSLARRVHLTARHTVLLTGAKRTCSTLQAAGRQTKKKEARALPHMAEKFGAMTNEVEQMTNIFTCTAKKSGKKWGVSV